MVRELKTNTAVIVAIGPFFDKTDGVTLETGLTITNEKITLIAETDDGNAPTLILDNITGATSGTSNDLNYITNNDAGMMQIELSAANLNRLGRVRLIITDAANHVPVWEDFEIVSAQYYDAKYGTGNFSADAKAISGDSTAADNLEAACDGNTYNVGGGAIVAASCTASTPALIADAVCDEVISTGHSTANSLAKIVYDNVNAPIATVDTVVDAIKAKTDALPAILV